MRNAIPITPELWLIPLDLELTGFQSFIGAWLYRGPTRTFLVDTGPAASVVRLVQVLEGLSVKRLDGILLTHVHIDHAGATGDLVERFPGTPVICHQAGIRHMADPARLWEGSLKTLGEKAVAYGPLRGVPEDLLRDAGAFEEHGVTTVPTPGHAAHHVSYRIGPYLFAGEAAGVFADLGNGSFFLRPATPPRFIYEVTVESLDRLLDTPHDTVCYGHFGATRDTPRLLRAHRDQLRQWLDTLTSVMQEVAEPDVPEAALARLLAEDPLLSTWDRLSPSVQQRERYFLKNSIRGFAGYLADRKVTGL
jgi:glyoxylase-like metal-dependent hydrolase (beta-lactamase superfamily II)